ncbi:MAG: hypothetical protein ACREF4_08650 [Gammaproteobacteria bacterium]
MDGSPDRECEQATSLHEAAHALVSAVHGEYCDVSLHRNGGGVCSAPTGYSPVNGMEGRLVDGLVSLAGAAGERVILGRILFGGDVLDRQHFRIHITPHIQAMKGERVPLEAWEEAFADWAEEVCISHQSRIEHLAKRLRECRYLSGQQVADILYLRPGDRDGPFLDEEWPQHLGTRLKAAWGRLKAKETPLTRDRSDGLAHKARPAGLTPDELARLQSGRCSDDERRRLQAKLYATPR